MFILFTDEDKKVKIDHSSPTSFEFGDVKEILEELAIAKSIHKKDCEEGPQIELENFQKHQPDVSELEKKVPKDLNSEKDSESQSLLNSTEEEITKPDESENNNTLAALSDEDKLEALCPLDKIETSPKCKNNAKKVHKTNSKENRPSHFKSQTTACAGIKAFFQFNTV